MPQHYHESPKWIRKFLSLLLDQRILESSLGDLEEKFYNRIENNVPVWKAKVAYVLEGLGFIKMATVKDSGIVGTIDTLSHTWLFFTRLVKKDKSYYLVSLLGLTLSLSCFYLIILFINDELNYDRQHVKSDRIFRVTTHMRVNDVDYHEARTYFPAAAALKSEFGEIEESVRLFPQEVTMESGDRRFQERLLFADDNFFNVFSFPLIYGDINRALPGPGSILLTESAAIKYFGDENPIGKTIMVNGHPLAVAAVLANVPEQSHIKFDAIAPLSLQLNYWKSQTGIEGRENKWYWIGAYTYVLLKDGVSANDLRVKMPLLIAKYFPERFRETGRFELQPLKEIHLESNLHTEMQPGGSLLYVRLFSVVAWIIIIVSAINLINLTHYKIGGRAREVGIRKLLGQDARKVIAQLTLESVMMGLIAFALTLVACQLLIGHFNNLVQKNLDLWNWSIITVVFGLVLIISVLAVIGPAIRYTSRSTGTLLLPTTGYPDSTRIRNSLIGLQVAFSFVLLVFSFIIASQLAFFRKKDLGYNRENLIVVTLNQDVIEKFVAFKNELRRLPGVINVAGAEPPVGYNAWRFVPEGGSYEKPLLMPYTFSDEGFVNAMGIRLLAGKNFDPVHSHDSLTQVLINQRAAIELGWQSDPIGRKLEVFAAGTTKIMARSIVVGLINDYHFESLHQPVKPLVIAQADYTEFALIRISDKASETVITSITDAWNKFTDRPMEYQFHSKNLETLYYKETKLSNVIGFLTLITLYLTCYGLFAMSSMLFRSRLKEVVIRKVLGANQLTIIRQFYSKYILFSLASMVVGLPVAIYAGNLWLQTFQYRIVLDSSLFIKAGLWVMIATMLSVTYYLMLVARSSPVKFLRRD